MNHAGTQGLRHRRHIESLAQQRRIGLATEQVVLHSWLRCFEDHALDPAQRRKPQIVDAPELRRRRAAADCANTIARAEILTLASTLGLSAGIVFTDADGVILQYAGAPAFAETARRSGFRDGAVWSESEQGTNGMGTCLVVRKPVVIEHRQHFLAQNTGLSCFAAPVIDGRGGLVGVLDISCSNALPHAPMLAVLNLAVLNIENRLLWRQGREHFALRFHRRPQDIGTALEGVVMFDRSGIITGVNRAALRLLEAPSYAAVCGQQVESFLGIDMRQVDSLAPNATLHCRPRMSINDDKPGFGQIQSPAMSRAKELGSAPARDTLAMAERAALLDALEHCGWNISDAARKLGLARKTLYRKMSRHGLQRTAPATD